MSILTHDEWLNRFNANPEMGKAFRAMIEAREEDRGWTAEKFVDIKIWRFEPFNDIEEIYETIEHWCQYSLDGHFNRTIYGTWFEFQFAHDAEEFDARWNNV